ncbi:unnamed protein product [Phyllotreta striolata]|uniref:Vitellogenin domain-containing protein n=1 Tax=Phyllotreta striolata TaxID=444603 RepID=A0A9P0DRN9_PHYSR|nr:unnamed protein product [Phyllotreta striolata]
MNFFYQFAGFIFLAILVSADYNNPLENPNVCGAPVCKLPDDVKFKYGPGTAQTYRYSVEVTSLFNGTSKNESNLYIEGEANLAFLTPCDGVLTLSDVKLSENIPPEGSETFEHSNSQAFADAITAYTLRFSFVDGIIAEVCPKDEEIDWVLNFKKGILSMIQNSMKRFDLDEIVEEEDVRGKCRTVYKVSGVEEATLLIEKTKDLENCEGRSKIHSAIQSQAVPIFQKNLRKDHILKSTSRCVLSIDHRIYKEIKCEENYLLQPFSNYNQGARTSVVQKLQLKSELPALVSDETEITRRVPLTFHNIITAKPTHEDLTASKESISSLCKLDKMPDRMELADLFSKFIHSLRSLSYPALTELHSQAGYVCPTGKRFLSQALPFVSTIGSVSLMRDIILNEKPSEGVAKDYIFSIGLLPNPDSETMEVALNLLEEKEFSADAALSIASLTHTYCSQTSVSDCRNDIAVSGIVEYYEKHLRQLLETNIDRKTHDEIMVTLKALSNIGVISEDFDRELFKVIENSEVDVAIRVAAVESFRRTPCEDTRSYFEDVFRNQEADAEVRIASYLQIMRCPDYLMMRTVRHALLDEEVNQVGSFIWTHLKNLLKSARPSKIEVQTLLTDKDLSKKFDTDIRKFSRNFEGSLYLEEFNVGGNYESNVIFSTNSYVPKTAMLNLTIDLFGESFNILEIYGRVDGFEQYLESFFGPKGSSNALKEEVMETLRWPRDAKTNALINSQIKELPNVVDNYAKEPKVALGYKIFGNEANYVTFAGKQEIEDGVKNLDPIHHLKNLLSGKEINYNKAAMFLDGKYVVPCGAGLPLSLIATGTTTINIKLYGSLGSIGIGDKNRKLEVDLTADIQPTVSVDFTGEISVDAFYASTGIKLKTNLYSDTAVKGEIKIRDTKLASVKFSLPREKNEIFVAKSELLVKKNGVEETQRGLHSNRTENSMCSWPAVDQTIGLKLCTEYGFVHMNKFANIADFIIAGPANFRLFIEKADPTATVYLFEYKWDKHPHSSIISVVFDTPGSAVKRLISANVTLDSASNNITILIQSPAGKVLAHGRFKDTQNEKSVQIELNINNMKHLEAGASIKMSHTKHVYKYVPNLYLIVNGDKIVTFTGSVETLSKKGISQYSVKRLKFKTKRFTSELYGYIMKGENSIQGSLTNDYQFLNTKKHRVSFRFGAGDKSQKKNIKIYGAFLNLLSTAYPNVNLDANVTFHRSDNHLDLVFKLHQNPFPHETSGSDYNTFKFETTASHVILIDGKRTFTVETSIARKSSNLNLKGKFIYEVYRSQMNGALIVNYGDNKEVSATVYWFHPRKALAEISTHINVTIPAFTPMIVRLDILEKRYRDYSINFKGTWFSGHTMNAAVFYQDKSRPLSSDHHVKLLLMSPHFKDITIDLQFYRDNDVLKFELKGDIDKNYTQDYGISYSSKLQSTNYTERQVKLKYTTKLYSYEDRVYDGDYKKIDAQIHIDEIRDIIFSLLLYNMPDNKSIEFDINWDANRQANQKLLLTAKYKKSAPFDYIANFIVTYPGHGIKGDYKFLIDGKRLKTLVSVSRDIEKTFAIDLDIVHDYDKQIFLEMASELKTPFDNWKITRLNGRFQHDKNKYDLRGLLSWERRQKIELSFFGDYNYTAPDNNFTCFYSCSVFSTIDKIPNIDTKFSHLQNDNTFNTNIHMMYNPDFVIVLDSQWGIEKDKDCTSLTGIVNSKTPFKGFNSGFLVSKIMIKNKNYIRGAAHLNLDHKMIDFDMEGKFLRLSNCMLVINATTLTDKYQLRFIISAAKRHVVAMITYPTGGLGTELLVGVNSIIDFDIKLHVATPKEFLQELLLVAKLQPQGADFRVGWNFLLLGFSGVWHYANFTDFEYSYKIYTPIDGFEENGIVGKLIFKEGLDFEVSIKFSYYKLGVKLLGQPKPKPLKELGVKLKNVYTRSKQTQLRQTEEKDYDDPLSWEGLIELDVIIYPTMKGELEIDQKGTSYILQSKLTMPHGVAEIFDEFDYVDILNIKNNLEIITPYNNTKKIYSDFEINVESGRNYVFGITFDYLKQTTLIKTGLYAKYIVEKRTDKERTYNVTLKVNTPFKALPKLNLFGALETEENFYHTTLLFNTNRSDISVDATTEIDNGLLELTSLFHVTTPIIRIPPGELRVKKLFSLANNYVEVILKMSEKLKTPIYSKVSWLIRSSSDFRGLLQLETPFSGLENTTAGLEMYISDARSSVELLLLVNPIEARVNGTLTDRSFKTNSDLSFDGYKIPVVVDCDIAKPSKDRRDFKGTLKLRDKLFKITGNAALMGAIPGAVSVKFTPEDNSPSVTFEYQINSTTPDRYELLGSIRHSDRFTSFNANLTTTGDHHWQADFKVRTSNNDTFMAYTSAYLSKTHARIGINAITPIPKLENPKLGATYEINGLRTDAYGFFELTESRGQINASYIFVYMENMMIKAVGKFHNIDYESQSSLEGFYENPQLAFHKFKAGGDIKIDRLWEASSNITLENPPELHKALETHVKFPDEHRETYSLFANMDYIKSMRNIDYLVKYRTSYTMKKYGTWGKISTEDKQNLLGDIEVEWNGDRFNNFANLKRSEETLDLIYKLKTPKFADKRYLVTEIKYKALGDRHNFTCEAFSPEDRSIAYATVDYKELANMNGMFNISVPPKISGYSGAHFKTETNAQVYNRYIKVFWDKDNALLDNKCNMKIGPSVLDRNTKGKLIIELPLTTRHIALVDYDYDEKEKLSVGQATVNYNGDSVLEGKYNRLSESQAGKDTDTVHVELHNELVPVGADYIYKHEYGMPEDATTDKRHVHLYNLKNQSKFNVSGDLDILTKWSGREYKLTAVHSNRIVKFWTDYDILDKGYKQRSRLELSPSNWIEYDLNLFNKSRDDTIDAQEVTINVIYPRRSFLVKGFYNISDSIVSTDVSLVYDKDNKSVQAGLDWRRVSLQRKQLSLRLKHPTFERDVTFDSEYGYDKSSIDGQLLVKYSLDPNRALTLRGKVNDNSNSLTYNYSYNIWAEHVATSLSLSSNGDFYWNPSAFGTEHITDYHRSYLPFSKSEALAKINFDNNEIELKVDNVASGKSYFWGKYGGEFPVYTANMSAIYDTNNTEGEFYVNLKNKLLYLNLNMTEDGSQSLHMYGIIPDARSAHFDIWRDYDDKRISDVAYFLRLNHSRLIMSTLKWRPDLISDVTTGFRNNIKEMYQNILEAINNNKQYIRMETVEAINGTLEDALPYLSHFSQDLRHITIIEQDFNDFKIFLNESYEANEFYIKDITNIIITLFDDLAIKSQLQTLPKIVQEIWSVMGDSGKKIKESILWVKDKLVTYYQKATQFIHDLLNDDPMVHLSMGLDKLVEKYDEFIKNLHVAIIQYMENLWAQMSAVVVEQWHKMLASIEPTFLKFIHYLESIAWHTGKEFLDFLYIRKNEIIESPYFLRFTKFSQDLDKFYRDIRGSNTIASLYKYTQIAWNFLKEKYLTIIPFGKETIDVVNEIAEELMQIGEIPSVKFLINKWREAFDRFKYYYDYFDVETKIHKLFQIIYDKISDMSLTALEIENRQREAKTKFYFEPDDGIMLLEQKLPMPWHAFNETPKFKEIPEIKKIFDLQSFFEETELSFWNLYYDYKPWLNPSEILPPFKGHAMIVGSKFYATFDRKFYQFRGKCTYLLAQDFVDRNFTILASYDQTGTTNELLLIVKKEIVRIDFFNDRVLAGDSKVERLPMQIGETYLYKDSGLFKAESQLGFILECNMKFHTCMFEMSGWYYGKTAGLWGTYNNEPTDDFLSSNKTRVSERGIKEFGDSWALDKKCKNGEAEKYKTLNRSEVPKDIWLMCADFFSNTVSQLSTCFPRVPKESFLDMCLNSKTQEEACMSAVSYINLCSYANTPLRIPDTCVKCNLLNGSEYREGDFIRLQGSHVPQTADIVFIVEAKDCNKDLRKSRSFDSVVESLEKALEEQNIKNNRYAVVMFGGFGVYDEPRSIVINGQTFTDAKNVHQYFDSISIGQGNSDIFNGIMFAYNLLFRPGVSRNFVLVPCSECNRNNMLHDYSTIHQLLSESAISLHILMNNHFAMQKEREVRIPFGIDKRFAYTRRDAKSLAGDQSLRKSIILPKSTLGICLPLAFETNGTVFSAKCLEEKRTSKKAAAVFGKAVARVAAPRRCIDCECTAPDTGVSYMECFICTMANATRNNFEIPGLDDDELFSFDGNFWPL